MWTVVYISQSMNTSETLRNVLLNNNVISKLRRARSEGENNCGCYEVLVPELQLAQDLIIENELF